ncbi:MAG: hypothetical protein WDW38_006423 [Sanguina aurantia]
MTYMLNIIETFSLAMIYAQLAAMSIPTTMVTSDPLHVLVSNLVAVSVAKGPGATLADTLNTATSAVQAALEGSSNSHASILGILVPYMLTPFWTLSYYAAYADPTKRPNANIYDQRFGFMAVSETFGNWATFVQTWTTALVVAVGIAIFLLHSNNHSMLRTLIVVRGSLDVQECAGRSKMVWSWGH